MQFVTGAQNAPSDCFSVLTGSMPENARAGIAQRGKPGTCALPVMHEKKIHTESSTKRNCVRSKVRDRPYASESHRARKEWMGDQRIRFSSSSEFLLPIRP